MHNKKLFFIFFSFIFSLQTTIYGMEKTQSPIITFKKNDIGPGKIQDLDSLSTLIEMAAESFKTLENAKTPTRYNPTILFHIAKYHLSNTEEIQISKATLKHLVRLVIQDGGEIKEWSFGKIFSGMNMNVQLIAKNGKSLKIDGPILDAAGGFAKPNKELEAKSRIEIQKLMLQEKNGECVIN